MTTMHGSGPRSRGADLEMVEGAETFGELPLGGDGLAFALFLGGDAQIEGDRHAHTCVAQRARKCKCLLTLGHGGYD